MGRTTSRFDRPTINPASHLFHRGRFAEAKRELERLLSNGKDDVDVLVMLAVCDFRLGSRDALTRFRQDTGRNGLRPLHANLITHHMVIDLIKKRQFSDAISTLRFMPMSASEQTSLDTLTRAIGTLRQGQNDPMFKKRSGKIGVISPRENRGLYLPEAADYCKKVIGAMERHDGHAAMLIQTIAQYMLLLIELQMPDDAKNTDIIRRLRDELSKVDEDFKKSLPSVYHLMKFRHNF